jgi:error-prone DNA polymerase
MPDGEDAPHTPRPYTSIRDLWLRTGLKIHVLERLADADAFGSLGLTRRQALWAVKALGRAGDQDDLPLMSSSPSPLRGGSTRNARRDGGDADALAMPPTPNPSPQGGGEIAAANGEASVPNEPHVILPAMPLGEEVVNDYRFLSLSLRAHPASFLRKDLAARGIIPNAQLRTRPSGALVTVSGLVTIRQRPGSANVTFLTIEDETAIANIIVWPRIFERFRPVILGARFIAATGKLQHESNVIHVVSERLEDLTPMLKALMESAPPIEALARADAVKHPHSENRERSARPRSLAAFRHPRDQAGDIAAHLDVPAHGTAHAPTQRAR